MDKFAIKLKEIRTEKGFTQKQLAEAVKTTDDSIYSWEKAEVSPHLKCCVH